MGDINVMRRKILRSNVMEKFEAKGYGGSVTQSLYCTRPKQYLVVKVILPTAVFW